MNLIILENTDHITGTTYRIEGPRFRHIRTVLKAKLGDNIEAGLLNGPTATAKIIELTKTSATLDCTFADPTPQQTPAIDLICALPRPQTLKKVLQTAATMGVENIYLTNANRVEQCYFSASAMDSQNIKPQLLAGLAQGKRTILPKVQIHPRFRCFFEETLPRIESQQPSSLKLTADVNATDCLNPQTVKIAPRIILAIGPEGGWVDFELEIMARAGFKRFKLSNSTLRVENAVVAAIAQIELTAR